MPGWETEQRTIQLTIFHLYDLLLEIEGSMTSDNISPFETYSSYQQLNILTNIMLKYKTFKI